MCPGRTFLMDISHQSIFLHLGVSTHVSCHSQTNPGDRILTTRYLAVGIIGATVMPHSLFVGSALATQDRDESRQTEDEKLTFTTLNTRSSGDSGILRSPLRYQMLVSILKKSAYRFFRNSPPRSYATRAQRHSDHENNPLPFVETHFYHGIADVVVCLLGFAVLINSMYVIFL